MFNNIFYNRRPQHVALETLDLRNQIKQEKCNFAMINRNNNIRFKKNEKVFSGRNRRINGRNHICINNEMKKIFFLLVISCFVSCNQKKQGFHVSPKFFQCLNCSEEPSYDIPEYSNVRMVKLETKESCLITNIQQIEIADSLIFILSSDKKLLVYDTDGYFVSQIGQYGVAPEEYATINTFYIDSASVVIIDDVKSSLIKYDFHGKYLTSEKLPLEYIRRSGQAILTGDNKLFLFHGMNMEENMAYSLIDVKANRLIDKYFSYDPIQLDNYIYYFSFHPMMKQGSEEIHFIMPLSDTIYSYPSFLPKYIIEVPRKMATRGQIKNHTESYTKDVIYLSRKGFFAGFAAIYETKNNIYLECKYDGIVLGYFWGDKISQTGCYYWGIGENVKKIPLFHIIYSFDNYMVGVAQAEDLIRFGFKFDPDYEAGLELKKIQSTLLADDNPVLFFYEFEL